MDCITCRRDETEVKIYKCPICFRMTCEDCGRREYGRIFCSTSCANQFFFGDEED